MRASAMWWRRRLGSRSRHRRSNRRMPAGTFDGRRSQSGSRSRMAASVSASVSRPNALRAVNISYTTQPNAHTSLRESRRSPRACSGLIYAGVPVTTPSPVAGGMRASRGSGASALARPKSSTFTVPAAVSLMLPGLRSRWTMPLSCAASSASAIWRANSSATSSGKGPPESQSANVGPAMSSITTACRPPAISRP